MVKSTFVVQISDDDLRQGIHNDWSTKKITQHINDLIKYEWLSESELRSIIKTAQFELNKLTES